MLVTNNKKVVFESGLVQLMDEAKRFKLIQSKFIKLRKNHSNYIFIGDLKPDVSMSLEKLVIDFITDYYDKATHDIVPPTLIVSDAHINDIKKELINKEIIFNDGYEAIQFSYKLFTAKPVLNLKLTGNRRKTDSLGAISFKVRLIALSTYENITTHELLPDMVYAFNVPRVNIPADIPTYTIDCLGIKRVYELLK